MAHATLKPSFPHTPAHQLRRQDLLLNGGFERGAVHEISGTASHGVIAAVVAQIGGHAVWCTYWAANPALYMPGLSALGLDPSRLVVVLCRRDGDILWAMEEALKSGAVTSVIGAPFKPLSLVESRRLLLAAKIHNNAAFVLPAKPGITAPYAPSARTRWHVSLEPGSSFDVPRWRLELVRSRNGQTGIWSAEWHGKTLSFDMVPKTADRPARAAIHP